MPLPRTGARVYTALRSSVYSPPSYRRNAGFFHPLEWVREKLAPKVKEKQSAEEIDAAKERAKQEGKLTVFEDINQAVSAEPSASAPDSAGGKVKEKVTKKKKIVEKPKGTAHKYSTANFKVSHRKLNLLANQIAGKPIDYAILQMQFSEKRHSTRILNMLATARDHARRYKSLEEGKLVIAEAWVTKGPRPPTRLEPRGRGHFGTRKHFHSKMNVVLKEGKTVEQQKVAAKKRKLDKIVSASLFRENKPIRNPSSTWAW